LQFRGSFSYAQEDDLRQSEGSPPAFPAPLPAAHSRGVPLPARQEPFYPGADGPLLVTGACVRAVQLGNDLLGADDLGELGAAAALSLGRRHHSLANAGTAHAADPLFVTFCYHAGSSRSSHEKSRNPAVGGSLRFAIGRFPIRRKPIFVLTPFFFLKVVLVSVPKRPFDEPAAPFQL
jgi:hypothetical protein